MAWSIRSRPFPDQAVERPRLAGVRPAGDADRSAARHRSSLASMPVPLLGALSEVTTRALRCVHDALTSNERS